MTIRLRPRLELAQGIRDPLGVPPVFYGLQTSPRTATIAAFAADVSPRHALPRPRLAEAARRTLRRRPYLRNTDRRRVRVDARPTVPNPHGFAAGAYGRPCRRGGRGDFSGLSRARGAARRCGPSRPAPRAGRARLPSTVTN